MTSDRSWIGRSRFDAWKNIFEDYKKGVASFIKFSSEHVEDDSNIIRWPYQECENKHWKGYDDVTYDLYRHGIMEWYTKWDLHGEKNVRHVEAGTSSCSIGQRDVDMYDVMDMLRDIGEANRHLEDLEEEPNASAKDFYKMLDSASEPIYPNNTDFTALSFVNKLLHFKNKHNCSNNGFDELLKIIGSVLPPGHKLPLTYYEVRKLIKGLHMRYEKINACENDCILFYKENSEKTHCDICTVDFPDVYNRSSGINFMMKAALMWTISDFPTLGMLSGWSTKGKLSCPVCIGGVKAKHLKHGGKPSFYGTARYFLEADDPLRRSIKFGSRETRSVTSRYSGLIVKTLCEEIQFPPPGKTIRRKPRDYGVTHNWTHFSPFFELPYWETLSLRHNIDVMHTEKNIFENIFFTLLNVRKKTKDNSKARKNCKELGVHRELWIQDGDTMPSAPYVLEKEQILKSLKWTEE
ncbi:hypothetical protein AgCh_033337 [Apium graveolens]